MKSSSRVLLILTMLLAVPLVAYVAAAGIQWKTDSTLHETLLKQFPDKAEAISAMTISSFARIPMFVLIRTLEVSANRMTTWQ